MLSMATSRRAGATGQGGVREKREAVDTEAIPGGKKEAQLSIVCICRGPDGKVQA